MSRVKACRKYCEEKWGLRLLGRKQSLLGKEAGGRCQTRKERSGEWQDCSHMVEFTYVLAHGTERYARENSNSFYGKGISCSTNAHATRCDVLSCALPCEISVACISVVNVVSIMSQIAQISSTQYLHPLSFSRSLDRSGCRLPTEPCQPLAKLQ